MGATRGAARAFALGIWAAAALWPVAAASGATLPPGPTATSSPVVIGVAAVGRRLTGLSGVWTGAGPVSYRFQWMRCNAAGARCLPIGGATSPTYTVVARDVGKTLGFSVYASDSTGMAAGYASLLGPIAPARPPLVATLQPLVSGEPAVGKTLTVGTGTWSPMVRTFSYAWERCNPNGRACAPIARATRRSYTVSQADLGHALVALVQATNATTVQNTFSTATAPVVAATVDGPQALSAPSFGGQLEVGSQLLATTGRWSGVGAVSFAFQWLRCDPLAGHCSAIRGATAASYRLGGLDAGDTIALTVRATDLSGTTAASAGLLGIVAPAGAGLSATAAPALSGSATEGGTLTAGPGSWSVSPTQTNYSWLRCNAAGRSCSVIAGQTTDSYTIAAADRGSTLVAEVEATAGGSTAVALSAATSPIA